MTTPEPGEANAGRIVVGIDGSPPSLDALGWAGRQAKLTGATLEVITTWEWPTAYGWGAVVPSDYNPDEDVAKMLDQSISSVLGDDPGFVVSRRVIHGHPAAWLVEASKGAELLVVGNRGHGEFVGMVIGSVSEHCASSAHCPVVVYRGE